MRTNLLMAAVLLGFGFAAMPASQAAPASGVLAQLATGMSPVQEARYVRRYGRTCYRKCFRDFVIGPRVCRTFC